MLMQFTYKNFRSSKDTIIWDLREEISENNLKTVSFANDTSDVYKAFCFMRMAVLNLAYRQLPAVIPFNSSQDPSVFEVFLTDTKERNYQYGFTIQAAEILEEWLYTKTDKEYRIVFYRRKGEELKAPGLSKKEIRRIQNSITEEMLVVSRSDILNIPVLTFVYNWFADSMTAHVESLWENFSRENDFPEGFVSNRSVQKEVASYLHSFDDSISDLDVKVIRRMNGEQVYEVSILRELMDGRVQRILLQEESIGIRKILRMYEPLRHVLKHGSLLFMDEWDNSLDPLLVKNIILIFLNPDTNPHHAQLILTCHDISQFSDELLGSNENI